MISFFDKYCQDKETDTNVPADPTLPHQFDTRRRASVSAECWAVPPETGRHFPQTSSRLPQKTPNTRSPTAGATTADPLVASSSTANNTTFTSERASPSAVGRANESSTSSAVPSAQSPPGAAIAVATAATMAALAQKPNSMKGSKDLNSSTTSGSSGGASSAAIATASTRVPVDGHTNEQQSAIAQDPSANGNYHRTNGSQRLSELQMGSLKDDSMVDAEVTSEPFPPPDASPETRAVYARIASALRNTIFFEELSDDLMCQVLASLERREVDAGVCIIKQGDEGNELFVLDEGSVEYIRDGKRVGTASSGDTFGELALLYNSPRAATVRTLRPCVVYALDRMTFKRIMVAKLSRKRLHSQQVLASIDVFAGLPESTQLRIADALHPQTYNRGDVIIKQGDRGYEFFLIDEGSVEVSVDGKVVGTLGSGLYFGELALIYDLPRAATVTAKSEKLKVEVLSSAGFEQLIGPELVAELRKRDPRRA